MDIRTPFRRGIGTALFIGLAIIFQPARGISDHGLDLVLVAVSLAALRMPVIPAAIWGAGAGILQDLSSVSWVGPHVIGNGLAAVMASWSRNRIYRERVFTQGLLVAGAALLQQSLVWALSAWGESAPAPSDAAWLAARTVLATSLAGFVASYALVRVGRRYRDPATA
jgi:rod shape-determining protein MreD